MKKWEYMYMSLGGWYLDNFQAELNHLGGEGWECCFSEYGVIWFKREVVASEVPKGIGEL